ncbi:MAG: hypothetical protein MUF54_23095 [Polyangiaceae bacterium]|nr:hypothetical protein [Polyangiaceae bacterium]
MIDRLKLRFRPPRLDDPEFGPLLFMYIANDPDRSYWEAEWLFPPVGYRVSIGLPGNASGPLPESRSFLLARVAEFDRTMELVRPLLDSVFREWLRRPLGLDTWANVKLAGFGFEDPRAEPVEWDVAFETTGERWLGITVPFVGNSPQDPVVDT